MEVDSQNENLNVLSQPAEQGQGLSSSDFNNTVASSDNQAEPSEPLTSDQEAAGRSKAKNIVLVAGTLFFVITLLILFAFRFAGLNL